MRVRRATEKDHDAVMTIQAENADLMPLDPYQIVNGPVFVAEDDTGIIGVAIARKTVEAFMYLKPSQSNYRKAKATRLLADEGFKEMGSVGYCEAHVFTTNEGFAKLLEGMPGAHKDDRRHLWVDLTGRV